MKLAIEHGPLKVDLAMKDGDLKHNDVSLPEGKVNNSGIGLLMNMMFNGIA